MDLNDVHYDAFLANDRPLADPQIVRVQRGGHIRLRVINSASSSQFWLDLGELVGRVVATDGHPVHAVAGNRFPLAMAQRLDILIDLPRAGAFPILARLEGDGRQTGIVLAGINRRTAVHADQLIAERNLEAGKNPKGGYEIISQCRSIGTHRRRQRPPEHGVIGIELQYLVGFVFAKRSRPRRGRRCHIFLRSGRSTSSKRQQAFAFCRVIVNFRH